MIALVIQDLILVNFSTHVKIRIMDHQLKPSIRDYRKISSYQRHKKQRLWQILVPVILAGLLLLAVAAIVVVSVTRPGGVDVVSQGADTSLIWLIIPVMMFAILVALILIALIILTGKAVHILPNYTFEAQRYGTIISSQIKLWLNKLTSPIVAVESIVARVSAFFSTLLGHSRE